MSFQTSTLRALLTLLAVAALAAACGAPVGRMCPLPTEVRSSTAPSEPTVPSPEELITSTLTSELQKEFDKQPEYGMQTTQVVPVTRSGLDNLYDTVVKVRTGKGTEVSVMYEVTLDPVSRNMVWKAEPASFARLQQTAADEALLPTVEQIAPEQVPADDEGDCTPSLLTGELICGIGDGSPPPPAP